MRISIVMPYYNRRQLILNTLKSLELFVENNDFEIVIVNDASNSENKIDDIPGMHENLNIKLINITKTEKFWVNPCIPFNIGFYESSGDAIILQNPECLHLGNIIKITEENLKQNNYLVFGCYAIGKTNTEKINQLNYQKDTYLDLINQILKPINNMRYDLDSKAINKEERNGWYQHSIYRADNLHFCSAILRSDLNELGGFDERFSRGMGKDDREFLLRIKRKKMKIVNFDNTFVIHQFHSLNPYSLSNQKIFRQVKKEKFIYSQSNDYFKGKKYGKV